MISRRLLRVKALLSLYAYYSREDNDLPGAEKELVLSIEKTYDLYHFILLLVIEIADLAEDKIEQALQKNMPTYEDLNPNRRFIDNRLIAQLRSNKQLAKYIANKHLSWSAYSHVVKSLFSTMLESEKYNEYMTSEKNDYHSDKAMVASIFSGIIPMSEELTVCLEELCIYWNDDLENVLMMVDRTLKKFTAKSDAEQQLVPLYKNVDDEEFVKRIFRKAITNEKSYEQLINENTPNWEIERIATMDFLVMQLAIAEIVECDEVPVKVTLNEYIEVAKYYCTSKSSTFVNGTLDQIVKKMKESSLFEKRGRGLIEESIS